MAIKYQQLVQSKCNYLTPPPPHLLLISNLNQHLNPFLTNINSLLCTKIQRPIQRVHKPHIQNGCTSCLPNHSQIRFVLTIWIPDTSFIRIPTLLQFKANHYHFSVDGAQGSLHSFKKWPLNGVPVLQQIRRADSRILKCAKSSWKQPRPWNWFRLQDLFTSQQRESAIRFCRSLRRVGTFERKTSQPLTGYQLAPTRNVHLPRRPPFFHVSQVRSSLSRAEFSYEWHCDAFKERPRVRPWFPEVVGVREPGFEIDGPGRRGHQLSEMWRTLPGRILSNYSWKDLHRINTLLFQSPKTRNLTIILNLR